MKKELITTLKKLDEVDFLELQHCICIAKRVKDMMKKHSLDLIYMAETLVVPYNEIINIIKGAYTFDLRMIVKIDCLYETLELAAAKKQIEPIISFPDFKYSEPTKKEEGIKNAD